MVKSNSDLPSVISQCAAQAAGKVGTAKSILSYASYVLSSVG
jgi:hypothetical protein